MKKIIARFVLYLLGVKLVQPDSYPKKYVIAVVPHTSNWDFPLGLAVRVLMDENVSFVAKNSLFGWPHGFIFRWLGGVPVNRNKRNNFVQNVAGIFDENDGFKVVLAPEGTRSKVTTLKSGFYYIAKTAAVPILFCAFDWGNGQVRFAPPFYPTDDKEKDFEYIYEFFSGAIGYIPENGFSID